MGKSFEQIGIDHSLPFIAVIMEKGDAGIHPEFRLPEGFSFSFFQPGDEERWAQLQLSVEHVDTLQQAEDIFRQEFLLDCAAGDSSVFTDVTQAPGYEKLRRRMLFVTAPDGQLAGTGALWTGDTFGSPRQRLHWIAVAPEYQGLGLAKAIVSRLLDLCAELGHSYVYLTTQTWSYRAAGIYARFGFSPYMGEKPVNWPFVCARPLPDFDAENHKAWELIGQKLAAYRK